MLDHVEGIWSEWLLVQLVLTNHLSTGQHGLLKSFVILSCIIILNLSLDASWKHHFMLNKLNFCQKTSCFTARIRTNRGPSTLLTFGSRDVCN